MVNDIVGRRAGVENLQRGIAAIAYRYRVQISAKPSYARRSCSSIFLLISDAVYSFGGRRCHDWDSRNGMTE